MHQHPRSKSRLTYMRLHGRQQRLQKDMEEATKEIDELTEIVTPLLQLLRQPSLSLSSSTPPSLYGYICMHWSLALRRSSDFEPSSKVPCSGWFGLAQPLSPANDSRYFLFSVIASFFFFFTFIVSGTDRSSLSCLLLSFFYLLHWVPGLDHMRLHLHVHVFSLLHGRTVLCKIESTAVPRTWMVW